MTTLREAAQQALEAMEKATRFMSDSDYRKLNQAIDALKAALAEEAMQRLTDVQQEIMEPEIKVNKAEPVAWMDREGDLYKMPEIEGWAPPHTMLYAAPPQRKPLTEEEIALIVADCSASAHRHDDFSFARAIERAHGIGD